MTTAEKESQKKQKASFEDLQQMAKRIQVAAAGGDPQTKAATKTATATEKIAEESSKATKIAEESVKVLKDIFTQDGLILQKLPPTAVFGA